MIRRPSTVVYRLNVIHRLRRVATFVVAFAAGVWVCDRWMTTSLAAADDTATVQGTTQATAAHPATAGVTTGPTTLRTGPATFPTTRTAATRPVLPTDVAAVAARVREAYASHPLRLHATLKSDFDVAGMSDHSTHAITAVLESPTKFRHESTGELLIVADGTALIVLDVAANAYEKQTLDAAEDDAKDGAKLSDDSRTALAQQNPALFVAATNDAEALFAPTADTKVRLLPSAANDGGVDRIESTSADGTVETFSIDHTRGTIGEVTWDFRKLLTDRGATAVTHAGATLHYDETTIGGEAFAADQFTMKLPAGAREATAADASDLMSDIGTDDPSTALVNNPAPAISLPDLEGKQVEAIGDGGTANGPTNGDVVMLDFWATWCPPCRAGLPHVNDVAERFKERGVRVYAVNQGEDAETVKKFITGQKLSALTALLDADAGGTSEIGKRYHVRGIPQTVVIGRDGKVRKVFVGYGPDTAKQLDDAVENALK